MHDKPEPTKLHQSRYDSETALRVDLSVLGCLMPKVREKRCAALLIESDGHGAGLAYIHIA